MVYFVLVLQFRLAADEQIILHRYSDFGVWELPVTFVSNLSYNDTYYFLVSYFRDSKLFWGTTYFDLLLAPLPSTLFPMKPPVDEGVYVKALAEGNILSESAPARDFLSGSWPPETFGVFLMNFGWYSVWLAGALMAICFWIGIRMLQKANFRFFAVFLFFHFILNFQLTNLRIVNFLSLALFVAAISVMSKFLLPSPKPANPRGHRGRLSR